MRQHDHFEWDPAKAETNRQKHGVTFLDAARVLADDDGSTAHVDRRDSGNSIVEERYVTLGSDPADREIILVVCWTDRSTADVRLTRIISARRANRRERGRYAQAIGGP